MNQEWTMESHDVSGVAWAPDITFSLSADRHEIVATPPGGHIRITATDADGKRSRVVLTNTEASEVFADIESTHVIAPSLGDDWNTSTQHATEIAAALYWSMWRRQQIRAAEQDGESCR